MQQEPPGTTDALIDEPDQVSAVPTLEESFDLPLPTQFDDDEIRALRDEINHTPSFNSAQPPDGGGQFRERWISQLNAKSVEHLGEVVPSSDQNA